MRISALIGLAFLASCASSRNATVAGHSTGPVDGGAPAPTFASDAGASCEGLACAIPVCADGTTTAIEGKVFDPAGKAPLYNVRAYVPAVAVDPFPEGVDHCDRCATPMSGHPIAAAVTDESGHFRLEGVPAGEHIPLVVQIGKFRRTITLPKVEACATTTLADGAVALPRNQHEGELPRIAVVTGGFDELGCILRRIGLDDAEFGAPGSNARIHVFMGDGGGDVIGGGAQPATALWNDADTLSKYDAVLLACEGAEHDETKTPAAKEALFQYVAKGGRVFATHYHYTWLKNSPEASFQRIATWNAPSSAYGSETDAIDTSFPKGAALAKWLMETGASTTEGSIAVDEPARNVAAVDGNVAQSWIVEPTTKQVRYFSVNAPVGAPADQQCGRLAFTDVHSREHLGAFVLPTACDSKDMTPQERALEFMLFDLSACVQPDSEVPAPPPLR